MPLGRTPAPSFPNEVFHAIISQLPTADLPRVAAVNTFFYASTIEILYRRLVGALARPSGALILRWHLADAPLPNVHVTILRGHFEGVLPLGGPDFGNRPRSFRDLRELYASYQLVPQSYHGWRFAGPEVRFRIENGHLAVDTLGHLLRISLAPSLVNLSSGVTIELEEAYWLLPRPWFVQNEGDNDEPDRILWLDDSWNTGIRLSVRRSDNVTSDLESDSGDALEPGYTVVLRGKPSVTCIKKAFGILEGG